MTQIQCWRAYEYVQVFRIVETRRGKVYKTASVGFAHRARPQGSDEIYAAIPLERLRGREEFTLELLPE